MPKTRRMNHEGSICRRSDGRYVWKQMIDGVERSATAKTMPELKKKIDRFRTLPVSSGKVRVEDWNKKWLSVYVTPMKRIATAAQYEYMVRHIDAVIGKRYVQSIQPSDIQLVIAKANENGLSAKTMKHIRNVARLSFEQARLDRLIGENPVEKIGIPAKQAKPQKVFTPIEMHAILQHMMKSRWGPSVRFLLETGMRKGEMLALKWSDIDIDDKRATVDESLNIKAEPGDTKSARSHVVPLSTNAMKALMAQLEVLKKEGNPAIFRSRNDPQAWVFPNKKGEALHPQSYYTTIARAGKAIGIKASPHMLRHTFVSVTRGKLDLKDLQNVLGHTESTATLDIYGNMLNEKTDEQAKSIDEAFVKFEKRMKKAVETAAKNKDGGNVHEIKFRGVK